MLIKRCSVFTASLFCCLTISKSPQPQGLSFLAVKGFKDNQHNCYLCQPFPWQTLLVDASILIS